MLVIRRKPGESIVLSGGIEVSILELNAHGVKLGITAPASVAVLRNEIHLAQQANRLAAKTAPVDRLNELLSALRDPAKTNSTNAAVEK